MEDPMSGSDDSAPPSRKRLGVRRYVQEALQRAVEQSRAGLGRAAAAGRQQLELRAAKRDLDHFWIRLGKTSFHLLSAGEIDHPALRRAAARIRELEGQVDALQQPGVDRLRDG
jgi:hypothetical protein